MGIILHNECSNIPFSIVCRFGLASLRPVVIAGGMAIYHPSPKLLLPFALAGALGQAQGQSLFSDDFETDSSSQWNLLAGGYVVTDSSTTPATIELGDQNDYTVDWAFDYSQQSYKLYSDTATLEEKKVPLAPHSKTGSRGLKISVNKKDEVLSRNAVNLYPKDKSFSGDYILSFDLFLNHSDYVDGGVGTTEYALYGLNFKGTQLNWMSFDFSSTFNSPAPGAGSSDGIWFMNTGDGGAGRNWRMLFGQGDGKGPIDPALVSAPETEIALFGDRDGDGTADNRLVSGDYSKYMQGVFPAPPGEFRGVPGKTWVTVEVSQYKGTLTWKMNGKIISQFQNTTPYTTGDIMIGYMDIFDSVSSPLDETWGLFDNVQVNAIRTVVVDTIDNGSTPGDGKTSLLEALLDLQDFDRITFNIPGDGPHVIATPLGGYPLITHSGVVIDGYSQPGALPNSNPILGGNNAKLKIVLDSTSDATATNPVNPELPLRASTRLPYPGYGDSENAILPILGANDVTIRGLSFQSRYAAGSDEDPGIYCIALVQGSKNCHVQGNWFGLAPDGTTIKGSAAGVAAFRYRVSVDGVNVDTFSDNLLVGTDSDGLGDVGEFNIFAANHIAVAVELPGLRVSGNYFNVMPDGNTFLDVNQIHEQLVAAGADGDSVENIENGRSTAGCVIGVSGDGINDANERNIFNLAYYDTLTEFYSSVAENLRISGNYYGVGANGTSKAPPVSPESDQPNFVSLPGNSTVLIGSNRDGVSDDLEGNLIYGVPGGLFVNAGPTVPIVARANTMSGNQFDGFPFADGSNQRVYETYYESVVVTPLTPAPQLVSYENGILVGSVAPPVLENYPFVDVDIYLADPLAPSGVILPGSYLATRSEGVPEDDANGAPGEFSFDLTSLNIPGGQQLVVVASYQKDETSSNAGWAIVSPVSNGVSTGNSTPIGAITVAVEGNNLRLRWTGGTPPYQVQRRTSLSSGSWGNEGGPVTEPTALVPITADLASYFQVTGQ